MCDVIRPEYPRFARSATSHYRDCLGLGLYHGTPIRLEMMNITGTRLVNLFCFLMLVFCCSVTGDTRSGLAMRFANNVTLWHILINPMAQDSGTDLQRPEVPCKSWIPHHALWHYGWMIWTHMWYSTRYTSDHHFLTPLWSAVSSRFTNSPGSASTSANLCCTGMYPPAQR